MCSGQSWRKINPTVFQCLEHEFTAVVVGIIGIAEANIKAAAKVGKQIFSGLGPVERIDAIKAGRGSLMIGQKLLQWLGLHTARLPVFRGGRVDHLPAVGRIYQHADVGKMRVFALRKDGIGSDVTATPENKVAISKP